MSALLVGLDVGTSSAKAVAFTTHGQRVAQSRVRLPGIRTDGLARWQPLSEVVTAVENALSQLVDRGAPRSQWARLCLTTQRDTVIFLDGFGTPLSAFGTQGEPALVSWQDARESLLDSSAHCPAPSGTQPGTAPAIQVESLRTLPSFLAERWTGYAAECDAAWSRRLGLDWLGSEDVGRTLLLPNRVGLGECVGDWEGVPIHLASGDKNCELLAAGVGTSNDPSIAGLSLGSAISLGMITPTKPTDRPGVVSSKAALVGQWNVETGLPMGMIGVELVTRPADNTVAGWPPDGTKTLDPIISELTSPPCPELHIIPYFAPPLDAPPTTRTRAIVCGRRANTTTQELRDAWTRGVVCELRRLRPLLEAVSRCPIRSVVISGGGSAAGLSFHRFMADAFQLPVMAGGDAWEGARGAVSCVILAEGNEGAWNAAEVCVGAPNDQAHEIRTDPDPTQSDRWSHTMDTWMNLRAEAFEGS